jgi:hypothetical protein
MCKNACALSPQNSGISGGTDLSKRHEETKKVHAWISTEYFEKLEDLLTKLSTGDSFSERTRQLRHWLVNQKEGISHAALAQRLNEIEKREADQIRRLRRVMQPWRANRRCFLRKMWEEHSIAHVFLCL